MLPFTNEGGNQDEQYFSDGLSEGLINALSQFDGLKVISRNSAFQFRDSRDSTRVIGEKLGVAHLLEGTVQRARDQVCITATLVNAADGSVAWSRRYDKPYRDLFALQDAIAAAVAEALKAKLMTAPGAVVQSDRPPGGSLAAYAAYQRGMAYNALGTEAGLRKAIDAFGAAVRIDPRYVAAYAGLSMNLAGLAIKFVPADAAQAIAGARKAVATALALDPDSAQARRAYANLLGNVDMHWAAAEAEAQRALRLAPNDARVQVDLSFAVAALGQNERAAELARQALATDPRNANWYSWLSTCLAARGQLDDARTAVQTAITLRPGSAGDHAQLAAIEILRGDAAAALAAARQEAPGVFRAEALALAAQAAPDRVAADAALKELIAGYADEAPYQIAQAYALRRDPEAVFRWLDRAWRARDAGVSYLLSDPMLLRYRDDPRFAAFTKKIGLPTKTDAVAMKL